MDKASFLESLCKLRTKRPSSAFLVHIEIVVQHGMWPQCYGTFVPEGMVGLPRELWSTLLTTRLYRDYKVLFKELRGFTRILTSF